MSDLHLEPYLVEHPLLQWMDSRYLSLIASNARHESFQAGQTIFQQGEESKEFYILIHGEVAVEMRQDPGPPILIQTLRDGDVLGWSWLFAPYQWQFSARAVTPTSAYALDAAFIRTKCEADHDLGYELMKRFSSLMLKRLHAARLRIQEISTGPPK